MRSAALFATAVLALCVLPQASIAQQAPQSSEIDGRVTNQKGEPLKSVTVRATASRLNFYTYTDGDGNFVLLDIPPELYHLQAERNGYAGASFRTPVRVAAGYKVSGVAIQMHRASYISGKVLDEAGAPVANAIVTFGSDHARFVTSTRADGSFVNDMEPGSYYVSADVRAQPSIAGRTEVTESHDQLVTTYYPDALDVAHAGKVQVDESATVGNIDIHLKRGRTVSIRGTVVDESGALVQGIVLQLRRSNAKPGSAQLPSSAAVAANGTFTFSGIEPGSYLLQAQSSRAVRISAAGTPVQSPVRLVGHVAFEAGSDIDNLVLRVAPGFQVPVQVRVEGTDAGTGAAKATVGLFVPDPNSGLRPPPTIQVTNENTIQGIEPGAYRVRATPAGPSMYVKSIRFGDRDVAHADLDLTNGTDGKSLEVVLSPHVAAVSGTAHDAAGNPMAGAMVELRGPEQELRNMQADQYGFFEWKNLAPGDYAIGVWPTDAKQDQAVFDAQASKIRLAEDARATVQPPVIVVPAR